MRWWQVATLLVVLLFFGGVASCQYLLEGAENRARADAISRIRASAIAIRDEISADATTRNIDSRIAVEKAKLHLASATVTEVIIQGAGFEIGAQFDERWSHLNQGHRVRLCVAYVTASTAAEPVRVESRRCSNDPYFNPGLDEVVDLT